MPESRFESRDVELELDDEPRLEPEEPDEALMPSSSRDVARSLPLVLLLDEPFVEALRPSEPERSCELPRPELVLPDAPSPSLRLLLSPMLLELRSLVLEARSLPVVLRSRVLSEALNPSAFDAAESESWVRVEELPMPSSPWLPRSVRLVPDEPEDPDEPEVEPADWLRSLWLF